jgi:hypothetical protein
MKFLYTLLLFTFSICACAQKMPEYGVNRVRITDTTKNIVAEVLPVNSPPHAQSSLRYYWYASGKIQSLQGSFSGHLLNGAYHEFYLNKNLCAQGAYYQGLKDGTWKTWKEDGTLKSSVNWKKGVQSGESGWQPATIRKVCKRQNGWPGHILRRQRFRQDHLL